MKFSSKASTRRFSVFIFISFCSADSAFQNHNNSFKAKRREMTTTNNDVIIILIINSKTPLEAAEQKELGRYKYAISKPTTIITTSIIALHIAMMTSSAHEVVTDLIQKLKEMKIREESSIKNKMMT